MRGLPLCDLRDWHTCAKPSLRVFVLGHGKPPLDLDYPMGLIRFEMANVPADQETLVTIPLEIGHGFNSYHKVFVNLNP